MCERIVAFRDLLKKSFETGKLLNVAINLDGTFFGYVSQCKILSTFAWDESQRSF